jgi:glycine/D-amino acid oxidase-like deaminating enzyme
MYGGGRALAKNAGVNTDTDSETDPAAAKYLRTKLSNYLDVPPRTSGFPAEGEWSGIMGFAKDSIPWVGGVPNMEGVWLCGGYTGHGTPLPQGTVHTRC